MRAVRLLGKKIAVFSLKALLVAIPAVAASYCSFRVSAKHHERDNRVFANQIGAISDTLERQSHLISRMQGEVSLLRLIVAARTGAGFAALPLPTPTGPDPLPDTKTQKTLRTVP